MGYKVKRIMVGDKQVRPALIYDFTQSDYGFTYAGATDSNNNHGRNSNGLYVIQTNMSSSYNVGIAWKIPSSIYNRITPKKIEITFNFGNKDSGGGISYSVDTKKMRFYNCLRVVWGTQNSTGTDVDIPVNIDHTLTIDLDNKKLSASFTNDTMALTDNAISTFLTDWKSGNICLQELTSGTQNGTATYTYIKKAIFTY